MKLSKSLESVESRGADTLRAGYATPNTLNNTMPTTWGYTLYNTLQAQCGGDVLYTLYEQQEQEQDHKRTNNKNSFII